MKILVVVLSLLLTSCVTIRFVPPPDCIEEDTSRCEGIVSFGIKAKF